MLTWVLVSATNLPVVKFPICIMMPLVHISEIDGIPSGLPSPPAFVRWTNIALIATKHVNELNCAVLGPGCEELLSAGGEVQIQLSEIYFADLHSSSAVNSPRAAQTCLATDAQVFVGSTSSEQSSLIAAFISGLGNFFFNRHQSITYYRHASSRKLLLIVWFDYVHVHYC